MEWQLRLAVTRFKYDSTRTVGQKSHQKAKLSRRSDEVVLSEQLGEHDFQIAVSSDGLVMGAEQLLPKHNTASSYACRHIARQQLRNARYSDLRVWIPHQVLTDKAPNVGPPDKAILRCSICQPLKILQARFTGSRFVRIGFEYAAMPRVRALGAG